jgi:hypothetical protein
MIPTYSVQCSLIARGAAHRPEPAGHRESEASDCGGMARRCAPGASVGNAGADVGPHRGHTRTVAIQRNQRSCGPRTARKRSPHDWRPRNTGPPLVGDTGIEPVTPTVSMLSRTRWLLPLALEPLVSGTSAVGCRDWRWSVSVAAWPPCGPSAIQDHRRRDRGNAAQSCRAVCPSTTPETHAPIEAVGCAIASHSLQSCRNRAGHTKGPHSALTSAARDPPIGARSLDQKCRALSLANIPSRTLLKLRDVTRDSSARPQQAASTHAFEKWVRLAKDA